MKLKYTIIAAVSAVLLSNANAATMVVSNVVDGVSETLYANNNGTLNTGGTATIGYFTDGYVITGVAATDIAAFTIVSTATIGGFSPDLEGSYAGFAQQAGPTVDLGAIGAGNALINRPVYSFVGNDASLAASSAHILIQVGTIALEPGPSIQYSSNPGAAVPVAGYGQVGPEFVGDLGGEGVGTYSSLQFVPEPSTALLGALGALALLRRRRN